MQTNREYVSENPAMNPPSYRTQRQDILKALHGLLVVTLSALEMTPRGKEAAILAALLETGATSYCKLIELTNDKV